MNIGTALASARARRANEKFRQAVENTITRLATIPDKPVRVSTKLAKHILLNYEVVTASGRVYSTQMRNIGAGVQEIYLKEV